MAIDTHTFLSAWFSECEGKIEIRVLPGGKQQFFSIHDYEAIDAFASQHSEENVYFGTATRNGHGGTKANVLNIPGVWADIDFDKTIIQKADKLLKECPLPPTFIVQSGNGYHAYWRFKEPTDNIEIVELLNRQLAQYFESDPVHDATRILRLPNTFNHKYSPKRPVEVLIHNERNQYDQSDFEEHLPPLRDAATELGVPRNPPGWQNELLNGVIAGERNKDAVRLVGRYLAKGLSEAEVLTFLEGWNQKNKPPLGRDELRKVLESVSRTDQRNHPPQKDPLQFPDVISGGAKEFADAYGSILEAPHHFFFVGYLAMLGLVITGKVTLDSHLRPQPRLYPFFIGNTATTKKSTAIDRCVEHYQEAVPNRFSVCWGLGSPEGLQEKTKKLESPRRVLLAYDEFKAFVSKAGIPQSVLLPCVSQLFEKNVYENITKNNSSIIRDVHLVMIAASTIDTYQRIWDPSFSDIGLDNRFFIVPGHGERKYPIPESIPGSEKEKLIQNLHKLLRHAAEYPLLRFTPEAKKAYEDWYFSQETSVHSNRLDTYALRFMILFAVNDMRGEIDLDIVTRVTELMNWQLEVRREYDPSDAESRTARMQQNIRKVIKKRGKEIDKDLIIRDRELRQYTHANREGLGIYLTALKQMREVGEIEPAKKGYHKLILSALASEV